MPLTLRLESTSTIPISVEDVIPESTCQMSEQEIARMQIWIGNQQTPLGEIFNIQKTGDDLCHVWQGNLESVHWIGAKLEAGKILVEGNAGRHLGSQMTGGQITVLGNVSDFVACENRGGFIQIKGDASNWLGAAYPGTKSGANGGTILVSGSAGNGAGFGMRRGTICVQGNAGRLTGWNMLAGTIIVGGAVDSMTGKGMKRGTILLPSREFAQPNQSSLPVSFLEGGIVAPTFTNAMQKWLDDREHHTDLRIPFHQFHGDQLKGGRGEVFVAKH